MSDREAEHSIPDERVGQYARLDKLGRGGQSVVWRALPSATRLAPSW